MKPTDRDRFAVPFIACGDLDGAEGETPVEGFLDADRSYDVDEGTEGLKAVQPPIKPPYETALNK